MLGDDGEPLLLRGTVQDETTLQRQAAALEATNRLLINMVAMVGHDVRQPVSVVMGILEHSVDTWPEGALPEQHVLVERAYAASRRLSDLVQDILTMVSVDTGELALRPEKVDVRAMVEDVVRTAATTEVRIVCEQTPRVMVDPFHLRQALTNLVANAETYGDQPVTVEVTQEDGLVRITVCDEGEGVPGDFVPQLFERFTRAQSGIASRKSGSGFGLFIVKELIEANGGSVDHAPNSPSGARFTLALPASD